MLPITYLDPNDSQGGVWYKQMAQLNVFHRELQEIIAIISGAASVPFSAAVPLNAQSRMPPTCITGALTFTPSGTAQGGACSVKLVADGNPAHIPNFAAFTPDPNPSDFPNLGWNNTAGTTNYVQMWWDGGVPYYTVWHPDPLARQTMPSVAAVSAVHGTNPTLVLALEAGAPISATQLPPTTAFRVFDNGGTLPITGVSVSGNNVSLSLDGTINAGDTVTLSYTPTVGPFLQDANSLPLYGIDAAPVTVS